MLAAVTILAQDSSNVPNCTDNQYNWTYNSLDQSPCYVAVALISMVNAGQTYTLPSVTFLGQIYGLEPGSNTLYFCNTVWYSLLSACALCQDGSWFTWPVYSQNCSQTYLMEYPGPIPSNTSVPTWAFLNVTATNDNFDPAKASSLAVAPSPTSSASTSSAATSSTSTSSTSTSTSHPTPNTSKAQRDYSGPRSANRTFDIHADSALSGTLRRSAFWPSASIWATPTTFSALHTNGFRYNVVFRIIQVVV
ncbi:hypothetical protein F5887DRAFT_47094 [Amanita rubescens]|nr:hypothetical protein F5887DRAFT_47094 [Amanita rubescens]